MGYLKTIYFKNQQYNTTLGHLHIESSIIHKAICSTVFIGVLFVIVRNWKQPRWYSKEEWTKKIWSSTTSNSMHYEAKIEADENSTIEKPHACAHGGEIDEIKRKF